MLLSAMSETLVSWWFHSIQGQLHLNKGGTGLLGTFFRPGTSSLRGQGHFYFAEVTFIGTSVGSLWETFEEAPRPRQGATEAMASV